MLSRLNKDVQTKQPYIGILSETPLISLTRKTPIRHAIKNRPAENVSTATYSRTNRSEYGQINKLNCIESAKRDGLQINRLNHLPYQITKHSSDHNKDSTKLFQFPLFCFSFIYFLFRAHVFFRAYLSWDAVRAMLTRGLLKADVCCVARIGRAGDAESACATAKVAETRPWGHLALATVNIVVCNEDSDVD